MLFVFIFVVLAMCGNNDRPATAKEWALCSHKRNDAIAIAQRYADLDKDGLICGEEILRLRRDLLKFEEKVFLFFTTSDSIMRRCAGGDNYISAEDFRNSVGTCLRDCKSVNDFFKYFGDRATARNYTSTPVQCTGEKPVVYASRAAAAKKKH